MRKLLKRRWYCFCLILFLFHGSVSAQVKSSRTYPPTIPPSPKYEVRAVWITTVNGLDWPKPANRFEQQRSLREMVAQIKAANFNTIFFQVRGRADAMYRSHYEPWAQQLSGTWGKDPGWDPLQFILDEAHAVGLEVHAWFNTFLVKTGPSPPETLPPHLVVLHPDWVKRVNDEWWLDPGLPQVRAYLTKIVMDIVRSYQIDGIHFDFIRYQGPSFPDETSYRRYGSGIPKDQWRRANITGFVHAVYDSIRAVKPMLKVGSTPIGIYTSVPNGSGLESYHSLYQDSRSWLQERKHDYLVPQVYWSLGNFPGDPDFESITNDWSNNTFGRHIYIGIGAYKPEVFKQLPELIDASRRAGVLGNSFFRYEHISQWWRVGERYQLPAIIPPMPWKDPWQPQPPSNLTVQEQGDGKFHVQWNSSPRASDGDYPKRYVVYRSRSQPVDISDPANIAAITTRDDTSFIDVISRPTSTRYFYAVTALDKMNNESAPTTEEAIVVSEITQLVKRFSLKTVLGEIYSHNPAKGGGRTRFIPFELGEWVTVSLKILDSNGSLVKTIFEEIRGPGKYVESLDVTNWNSGLYLVQFNTGTAVLTKSLRIAEESRRFGR